VAGEPSPHLPPEVERRIREGMFLLVDKPRGPTSHQVTAWVRDLVGVPLAGHAGTLDPQVSGVLWVGMGPALKLLPLMLEFPKTYVALVTFHAPVDEAEVAAVLPEFVGPIFQTPPVRSAVKRQRRVRRIHSLKVLESGRTEILIEATVDSGTYIRTLAVDLGDALGVGAHMAELRRTATGPFTEREARSLAELADAVASAAEGSAGALLAQLHALPEVWRHFPRLRLKPSAAAAIAHGADLAAGGILSVDGRFDKGGSVVLLTEGGDLLATGTALRDSEHLEGPGWVVDAERVLVDADRFPPTWRRSTRVPAEGGAGAVAPDPQAAAARPRSSGP
jgi:H/ACA ribonucleoprotein complex subunit 4